MCLLCCGRTQALLPWTMTLWEWIGHTGHQFLRVFRRATPKYSTYRKPSNLERLCLEPTGVRASAIIVINIIDVEASLWSRNVWCNLRLAANTLSDSCLAFGHLLCVFFPWNFKIKVTGIHLMCEACCAWCGRCWAVSWGGKSQQLCHMKKHNYTFSQMLLSTSETQSYVK